MNSYPNDVSRCLRQYGFTCLTVSVAIWLSLFCVQICGYDAPQKHSEHIKKASESDVGTWYRILVMDSGAWYQILEYGRGALPCPVPA